MNSNSRKKIKPKNENKVMKDNLFYQTLRFLKTLESPPAGYKEPKIKNLKTLPVVLYKNQKIAYSMRTDLLPVNRLEH